jgi:hypothetical protein
MMPNSLLVPLSRLPTGSAPLKSHPILMLISRMLGTIMTKMVKDGSDMKKLTLSSDIYLVNLIDLLEHQAQSVISLQALRLINFIIQQQPEKRPPLVPSDQSKNKIEEIN